jgi:hypothetical protein
MYFLTKGSVAVILKHLPRHPNQETLIRMVDSCIELGRGQGLTLVHFSAQPEPFLSLTPRNHTACTSQSAYVELKGGRV